jgi:hypothetical protein
MALWIYFDASALVANPQLAAADKSELADKPAHLYAYPFHIRCPVTAGTHSDLPSPFPNTQHTQRPYPKPLAPLTAGSTRPAQPES